MQKIITLVLTGCLMLFLCTVSFAGTRSFSHFSVNVPDGWEASETGNVVALLAPGHTAALSIAVDDSQGASGEVLAQAFAKQLNGTAPEAIDDDGYQFTFKNPSGIESRCLLYTEDNQYMLVTMTGENDAFGDIIGSLEEN